MKSTVKISGLREALKGLDQLKKSTQVGVLNRVLKKAAKPVEVAAKRDAPVDSGALKESIGTVIVRRNAGKSAFAAAMRGGESRQDAAAAARKANSAAAGRGASATVRVRATAPHAHLVEFGTVKMGAEPFLGPALRAERDDITKSIAADIEAEVAKTAKRIAARAAKKGTK
ncbi:HK97-gp10 family putative phage morphogenesis protein [Ancylobacter vacuolatus]|uniref:HK97 gp10 family phage protein n=1 Tax=Ancylobacter vacuolatus TaxID=223389 RepID=A0ABU0DLU0_9HYPH|nr:HK97-gp10 family putative phage morphogenesis protein [Ancylobacter vacuolatus]MDQ0349396.1 HK97 gp10 family phage protein [Ancylobacter vacuolatus]